METQHPPPDSSRDDSILLKLIYWHKLFESDTPPRLGIDVEKRIPYATMSAFTSGAVLGYYHGSKKAGLRFRAENAHRFPTTSAGWFQYHKTKNYISVVGGVKDAIKMGSKLGAGALAFCLFEETVDYARHEERDFLSTVTAGLSFSGIYSLLARHDVYTAARTAKLGLKLSLVYGLCQDALESMKGNRPTYVDFLMAWVIYTLGCSAPEFSAYMESTIIAGRNPQRPIKPEDLLPLVFCEASEDMNKAPDVLFEWFNAA